MATRDFAASVERGLHIAIGVVILAKTTVFASALTARTSYDARDVLLSLAVVACVGTAGVRCVLGRPGRVDVVLCTLAMVAGALAAPGHGPARGRGRLADHPPRRADAARGGRPAAGATTILTVAGLYVLLRWETGRTAVSLYYGVQEAAFITGTVLAVCSCSSA
ncbi:hypothetical protein GCM10023066_56140 [Nocardioides kongjuensis]